MTIKKYSLPLLAGLCFSHTAFAQEASKSGPLSFQPSISADLVSELQIEEFYNADNPTKRPNQKHLPH